MTEEHADLAIEAYDNYGKGRGRKANLNLGDFSYALAKATGLPLLFKGNDFTQTDLEVALRPSSLPPQVSLQVFLGENAPILRLTAPVFLQRLQVVNADGLPAVRAGRLNCPVGSCHSSSSGSSAGGFGSTSNRRASPSRAMRTVPPCSRRPKRISSVRGLRTSVWMRRASGRAP